MSELILRPPMLADVDAVVSVINRASRYRRGRDEVAAIAVGGWWTQPTPFVLAGHGDLGDEANDGSGDIWEREA